jgi:putative CRISPR-associated protein (TIGR02619 family)
MRTLITTVGTSLLTNRDDRPWAGWGFGAALPDTAVVARWLAGADPRKASAEIHTWHRLGIFETPEDERVILVHSQTDDGAFCAGRLGAFCIERGLAAQIEPVPHLSYADAATFGRGLGSLVRVLAEAIRSGRARGEVAIVATGGFKAEIAIANVVGALLGAPVYYIYEQFEQLIKLEPLPIALAPEWLREGPGGALLRTLAARDGCLERREVASLLQADGRLEMLLESVEEGGQTIVCANVLGELAAQLLTAPAAEWPPSCSTEPDAKIHLEDGHGRPRGWEAAVGRLARSPFVRFIRYDGAAGRRPGIRPAPGSDTDLHVVLAGGDAILGLRVETTAENAAQRRLVLDHLSRIARP